MAVILAACVTAFLISFTIIPVIIRYSLKKNLGDAPGKRKIHKTVKPSMGGVGIFLGFIIASLFWMDFSQWHEIRFVLGGLFLVFLIGIRDDLVPFRASHKLYGQILAVIIVMFSSIKIVSFYGLFGIIEFPDFVAYLITGFTVIVITNSFNLIDGLDGLAASVGLVTIGAFGFWFYFVGDYTYSLFAFSLIGATLAFIVYNWEPSEIFMGDTGAMIIGMILSIMVIRFLNVNYALPFNNDFRFNATIATATAVTIVPLSDTLRIIIVRLSKGHSPFRPDKSHIHHALMRLGFSHSKTALILGFVNLLFILMTIILMNLGDIIVLPVVIVIATLLSILIDRLILRKLSTKPQSIHE